MIAFSTYRGFRCVLEFNGLGFRKTYDFASKADANRYACACNARILSIEPIIEEVEETPII